jgi:UPF0755 protein
VLLGILAAALSAIAVWAWRDYQRFTLTALTGTDQIVELRRGQSLQQLVARLQTERVSAAPYWHWRLLAQQMDVAQKLQAGEYRIGANTTPRALLQAVADGKVVQYRFTILEGTRFRDVRLALAAEERLVSTLTGLSDSDVLARIGATETHAEGLLLPDTYFFPRGFSDLDLLKRAYWAQKKVLEGAWQQRQSNLPLADAYEALILASVIEKETGKAAERPLIAGVFVNRLRQGWRLQTDPTVIYGLGDAFDGNLTRAHLETDTPYNTYTRFGLPPTPIALPSSAAILAALQPEKTDAMFFVAKGDGSHQFSRTLEEHNRAVREYQL